MYMCYLDESGTPENPGNSRYFVLLGLAIPEERWKTAEQQIVRCKQPVGLVDSEIHAAWMARRYLEQESIPNFDALTWDDRRAEAMKKRKGHLLSLAAHGTKKQLAETQKNYRKTAAYLHLTFSERWAVLREVADAIGGWSDARIFAEVADKAHVYAKGNPPTPPFDYAFTEVVQRFEYFLKNRGNSLNTPLSGILIQDNNETVAKRLTEMMRRFHRQGTRWTTIDHIIETPLFVDSHLTSMVQMADVCGYATRRFFEKNETDLFNRIYPRFDRSTRGIVGIRHYTAPGCSCRVCCDHAVSPVVHPPSSATNVTTTTDVVSSPPGNPPAP